MVSAPLRFIWMERVIIGRSGKSSACDWVNLCFVLDAALQRVSPKNGKSFTHARENLSTFVVQKINSE